MRIHKAIENIQAAIDRHQDEWLKDNGFEPEEHVHKRPAEPEPAVKKPQKSRQMPPLSGQLSANRFLGGTAAKTEPEPEPELIPTSAPQPEPEPEQEQNSGHAEVVSVIGLKEHHSWLYNEVLKAINDAAENNKGTKIIAVIIPVIRSGEEFNDLPVDEVVTLPPVHDENVHVEQLPPFKELLEDPIQEQETETEPETPAPVSLEKVAVVLEPEPEQAAEPEPEPAQEPETFPEEIELAGPEAVIVPDEPDTIPEEISEPAAELEPETEPEPEEPEIEPEPETAENESAWEIISGEPENTEELKDIFRTMEEKLEETSQPEELPETEETVLEIQELQEAELEPEESEKFADELVDAIMEETIEDGQEEQNVNFDDLEPETETESESYGEKLEFTEIEQLEPAEDGTEYTVSEPEDIMLKDIALAADYHEEPTDETDDDEFDDTEILPDTETQE